MSINLSTFNKLTIVEKKFNGLPLMCTALHIYQLLQLHSRADPRKLRKREAQKFRGEHTHPLHSSKKVRLVEMPLTAVWGYFQPKIKASENILKFEEYKRKGGPYPPWFPVNLPLTQPACPPPPPCKSTPDTAVPQNVNIPQGSGV